MVKGFEILHCILIGISKFLNVGGTLLIGENRRGGGRGMAAEEGRGDETTPGRGVEVGGSGKEAGK